MRFSALALSALLSGSVAAGSKPGPGPGPGGPKKIAPKVMIVSLFAPEAAVWYNKPDFNLLAHNITLPGLSPLFPAVHCEPNYEICQVVTGESEINAASTISGLVLSPVFDLRKTYFFTGGIAGISPPQGTLADVTFARYAIQVALQYEFDAREKPANFSTGYFPQGSTNPNEYPQSIYGTEAFEYSTALRERAVAFARRAKLNDSAAAVAYRANYASDPLTAAAARPPSVKECDVATSDVYYSGKLLDDAFANYTKLVTNGTGVYCTTAQEDNAVAEVLVRANLAGLVDFSRVIVMRTASDFSAPYAGEAPLVNLVYADQGGFLPSIQNIYLAGREVVHGIVREWKSCYERGLDPGNYIGDIFDSLPQRYAPDFGLPSEYLAAREAGLSRRGMVMGSRGRAARRAWPVVRVGGGA